jgi:dTDP-4-amino-4,6-dideoxygalactose transaminase
VHGSRTKYYHEAVGINSRLDSLQAAILLVKMKHLEEWTEGRRSNASAYHELLRTPHVQLPAELPGMRHVYNQFTVRVPHRELAKRSLAEAGIGAEVYYPVPLHLQDCFAPLGYKAGDFPHSEAAAREVLSLPIEPGLNRDDIAAVCERLGELC